MPRVSQNLRIAFTLVELLVVIVIIGILAAVSLAVARKVTLGGRNSLTQDTIRVLDMTVGAFKASQQDRIATKFVDEDGLEFPLIDARIDSDDFDFDPANPGTSTFPEPSLAAYLRMCEDAGSTQSILEGLSDKLVSRQDLFRQPAQNSNSLEFAHRGGKNLAGLTVKDAFGNAIRFVHPAFDGGYGRFYDATNGSVSTDREMLTVSVKTGSGVESLKYRRSYRPFDPASPGAASSRPIGDADEGICEGENPYFYSSGFDGDPGTRDDNVYTIKPTFPAETRKFE